MLSADPKDSGTHLKGTNYVGRCGAYDDYSKVVGLGVPSRGCLTALGGCPRAVGAGKARVQAATPNGWHLVPVEVDGDLSITGRPPQGRPLTRRMQSCLKRNTIHKILSRLEWLGTSCVAGKPMTPKGTNIYRIGRHARTNTHKTCNEGKGPAWSGRRCRSPPAVSRRVENEECKFIRVS